MKLRWLAIAAAVAAFSAAPWTVAQVSDQDKDQPKAGDVQNAPKQPPASSSPHRCDDIARCVVLCVETTEGDAA